MSNSGAGPRVLPDISPADLPMLARAAQRWNLDKLSDKGQSLREKALAVCLDVLEDEASAPKLRLAAVRCLIAADLVNARREANAITERSVEIQEATARLRAALALPGAPEALAALTEQLLAQPPTEEPTNSTPEAEAK